MRAELQIETVVRSGVTRLKHCYCTPPFKIADITENKKKAQLHLVVMSSSPGILDGDVYTVSIRLGEHSSMVLQTQSYQRLFTMKESASQQTTVHMSTGADFQYLPHPVVPHQGSNYSAHNTVYLSENCTLVWGEVLTCGRKLNGEIFTFTRYHSITEIFHQGRLVIRENLLIRPAEVDMTAITQMEGYTHQASLIYLNQHAPLQAIRERVTAYLSQEREILFGVTLAPVNGIIIRMLGYRAEQLHQCLEFMAKNLLNNIHSPSNETTR